MNTNLRRHELVQERADQGGERGVLAHMKREFSLNSRKRLVNLALIVKRRNGDYRSLHSPDVQMLLREAMLG